MQLAKLVSLQIVARITIVERITLLGRHSLVECITVV